jgi:uncharacterized protein (TIGR00369 family)
MDTLSMIQDINRTAPLNEWAGFEVIAAGDGQAEIRMAWRPEAAQYSGYLHAGMIGALLDTVCGFAAATIAGRVLASHYSVNCLRPTIGDTFIAKGKVIKAGRRQVYTAAELFAVKGDETELVATGETLLIPVAENALPPG